MSLLPEVSPKSFWYVELQFTIHEVAKDTLDLHQHLLVDVLPIRVSGRREGLLFIGLDNRNSVIQ